ncbi:MAG TPA: glycosyltransferase family 4 protein [Thermoleophilaceae bacterium]|nr:glycosyltransferase family 4 protein [Thermoleophilaceae bacterium]
MDTAHARILFRLYPAEYSGAELFSAELIAAAPGAVACCSSGTPVEALLRQRGLDVDPIPFRAVTRDRPVRSAAGAFTAARDLRRVLARHPDARVVYGTSVRAGVQASLAAAGLGRTVVWGLWDPTPAGAAGAAVRAVARARCDLAVACSEWTAQSFTRGSGALRARTVVVHPGIRHERLADVAAEPGAPRAVIAGSLIPEKRVELALEVAGIVQEAEPRFELAVAGMPQYHARNREYAAALARVAGEGISFLGHVPIETALAGSGMLLHCRPDEPFATVIMEAMAAGLPVVAPASGGTPELVRDGVDGLLYPPGSATAAAEAVLRLVREPALAARLGASGRERVRAHFGVEAWLERHSRALAGLT